MHLATQLLLCMTVGAVCAGLVRAVRLPLALVQVVAGAVLAWPIGVHLELEPHAFLALLIPPLLYIDARQLPKHELRTSRALVAMLAIGLVAITVAGVGLLASWLAPGVPATVAFAIAAALSTTDHVAVTGITGATPMPQRLYAILVGEALFGDATGLVAQRFAIAAMVTGVFSWGHALGSFVLVSLGGIAAGAVLAWLFVQLLGLVLGHAEGDVAPRILLLLIFPYAAYLAAEHLGVSGVLAVVTAGLVADRVELIDREHRSTRLQRGVVLHMMEDALDGLVFVLLGLQLPMIVREVDAIARDAQLSHTGLAISIAAVIAGLLAIRFAWVWMAFRMRSHVRPALRLVAATALAGVRGAVTLAAALTLPVTLVNGGRFPARELAIFVCAIVIVAWLVIASVGLPVLLRGIELPSEPALDDAQVRAELASAAIAVLERQRPSPAVDHVIAQYRARLRPDAPGDERELQIAAIEAERTRLRQLELDEPTFARHLRELDLIEEALDR